MTVEQLSKRVSDFVSGRDRSKRCAGEIEVLLDTFGDREPYTTAAHMLASYDPSGGGFMYDEAAVTKQLELVASALGSEP